MSLVTQLNDYINAAFSGLWVQTVEPDEAERELVEHARRQGWTLAVWDIARGLRFPADSNATVPEVNDPLAVLKALPTLVPTAASTKDNENDEQEPEHTTLLVLPNFHRFLNSTENVQTLFEQLVAGKQRRTFVAVLSPVVTLPVELERAFVVASSDTSLYKPSRTTYLSSEISRPRDRDRVASRLVAGGESHEDLE